MKDTNRQDLYQIPAFSEQGHLHAVIEVPAATNVKGDYRPEKEKFSSSDGKNRFRVVQFLPYPSNYGFAPSTLMGELEGSDGDPIDIILFSVNKPRTKW